MKVSKALATRFLAHIIIGNECMRYFLDGALTQGCPNWAETHLATHGEERGAGIGLCAEAIALADLLEAAAAVLRGKHEG